MGKKNYIKEVLEDNVKKVINEDINEVINDIDKKLESLQKELLKVANSNGDIDKLTDEIYKLRELKQDKIIESAENKGVELRIDEMKKFLEEQKDAIKDYDEQLTRKLIEKITVYDTYFYVEFKSKTHITVAR